MCELVEPFSWHPSRKDSHCFLVQTRLCGVENNRKQKFDGVDSRFIAFSIVEECTVSGVWVLVALL